MKSDGELLQHFAATRDNDAFAELVRRNIDFVYNTALRVANGDVHLARDATQSVFVALAGKARGVSERDVLKGWLHTSARFATARLIRTEQRRRKREEEAMKIKEWEHPEGIAASWLELRPLLDGAIGELKPRESDAVLLRFFEKKTFADIGARLQLTETAARSCVDRALAKMHRNLTRRGIQSSAAALVAALEAVPAVAAPPGLAATINIAALSANSASAAGVILFMSKLQTGVIVVGVVAGLASVTIAWNEHLRLRAQQDAYAAIDAVPAEPNPAATTTSRPESVAASTSLRDSEKLQLTVLRNRVALLSGRPPGVVDAEIIVPHNVGRASPEAAAQTLMWSVQAHDVRNAASFIRFVDDSPENREQFMAHFTEAIRRRYPTPEEICVAGNFGIGPECYYAPDDGMQIVSVSPAPGDPPGKIAVYAWYRHNGSEYGSESGYVPGDNNSWYMPAGLTNQGWINYLKSRLDPSTGNFVWHSQEVVFNR